MIKLQNVTNSEYQRRPTRIVANETPNNININSHRSSRLATSCNSTSRLKCSTITKVPPANKCRLKQPVVSANNSNQPNDHQQDDTNHSKFLSRLAKPTTTTSLRARPTSLALKCSHETNQTSRQGISLVPAKVSYSSILPKLQTQTQAQRQQDTSNSDKTASRSASSRLVQPSESILNNNASKNLTSSKSHPTTTTIKRKNPIIRHAAAGTQAISTSSNSLTTESRLGGLKNLIAVVHPQHSQQRVNSSAVPTTVNKISSQTTSTTTRLTSLAASSTSTAKIESARVNSNHKDVNGREKQERRECKQSEHDSSLVRQQFQTTSNISPGHLNHQGSNGFTLHSNSTAVVTTIATATATTTTATTNTNTTTAKAASAHNGYKNDQFAQSNNSTSHLLSVASNHCDDHDKKQDGNNKQSSEHLSERHKHSTSIKSRNECENKNENENGRRTNNCYNHGNVGSTLTKSPAIYFKRDTNIAHAINNYILPKPMGQQVLSLMMLDVGLMPASNNQHQQLAELKKSHVCLPSPSKKDSLSQHNHCVNTYSLMDERDSFRELEESLAPITHNTFARDHFNSEQCNEYHSLQPTDRISGLQVRVPEHNFVATKSISLPASPSIRTRDNFNKRFHGTHLEASNFFKPYSTCQTTHCSLRHENFPGRKTSPAYYGSHHLEQSRDTDRLLTVCDSQDSHSLASSSCSSLNQCPPLLALSNKLEGFKFEELVRASAETLQKSDQKDLSGSKSKTNLDVIKSLNQVAQAEEHKLLEYDVGNKNEEESLKRSEQVEACILPIQDSLTSNHNSSKNTGESRQLKDAQVTDSFCEDDRSTPQLRRQHQPRSHSISGQEFHSNGGHGRLHQALHGLKNPLEAQQNYNTQSSSRIHQTLSPYQVQQISGRSPSPINITGHISYTQAQHENSANYSLERSRNHLHASLECLNSDYRHQPVHQQQQQYLQQQQQHYQVQNQHYAASYVPATAPANTVINQTDNDLAAAAMGNPMPQMHHQMGPNHSSNINPYNYQTQNLINRAMVQVSQSPSRRVGSISHGVPTGIFSHLTNFHHPMRAGHSSLSLASSSFLIEDKLQNEIKKLQSELKSEKEKNEALSSQLNINTSLMAAFEQSLTTLNTRLRQLTTLNEKKDKEIEELRDQIRPKFNSYAGQEANSEVSSPNNNDSCEKEVRISEKDSSSEAGLNKVIEDLKRQLIEKDRILTDTRLEALSAAHQLEQLESKLNGEQSLLMNEDDLDEGVMVVNHSPSDSDAITDSVHFNELSSKLNKSRRQCNSHDSSSFKRESNVGVGSPNEVNNTTDSSPENNNITDSQSNHSSDCLIDMKEKGRSMLNTSVSQEQFIGSDCCLIGAD